MFWIRRMTLNAIKYSILQYFSRMKQKKRTVNSFVSDNFFQLIGSIGVMYDECQNHVFFCCCCCWMHKWRCNAIWIVEIWNQHCIFALSEGENDELNLEKLENGWCDDTLYIYYSHMLCIQWFDFITHLFINAKFTHLKDQIFWWMLEFADAFSVYDGKTYFEVDLILLRLWQIMDIDREYKTEFSTHVNICHLLGLHDSK